MTSATGIWLVWVLCTLQTLYSSSKEQPAERVFTNREPCDLNAHSDHLPYILVTSGGTCIINAKTHAQKLRMGHKCENDLVRCWATMRLQGSFSAPVVFRFLSFAGGMQLQCAQDYFFAFCRRCGASFFIMQPDFQPVPVWQASMRISTSKSDAKGWNTHSRVGDYLLPEECRVVTQRIRRIRLLLSGV